MPLLMINAMVLAAALQGVPKTPPSTLLSFGDLDLRTAQGAADLRDRIDRTVVRLSGGPAAQPGSFLETPELAEARADGRRQADALIRDARRPGATLAAAAAGRRRCAE